MAIQEKSNREQILERLLELVSGIEQSAGFHTDAGHAVALGERVDLGEQDPDVGIAIVLEPDEVINQHVGIRILLTAEIQALAKVDINEPYLAIERVLADIKRAIEIEDRKLGILTEPITRGSTRTITREPGSTTAGVGVSYRISYPEVWGNP